MKEIDDIYKETGNIVSSSKDVEESDKNLIKDIVEKWNLLKLSAVLKRYSEKYKFNKLRKYSFTVGDEYSYMNCPIIFYKKKKKLLSYKYENFWRFQPTIGEVEFDFDNIIDIQSMIKEIAIELKKYMQKEKDEIDKKVNDGLSKKDYMKAIEEIDI